MKYEVTPPLVDKKVSLYFFKRLNNTPLRITQTLVVLNTTNPFFTCSRQQISCNLGVSEFFK
jgi:hypothetical protein